MQYLVAFCNRPEGAGDVISCRFVGKIVLEKCVKFGDPCLNHSREILPEAIGSGIFDSFSLLLLIDNDVLSGVALDRFGVGVDVRLGDPRSNGSRYIRGADFVSNERI